MVQTVFLNVFLALIGQDYASGGVLAVGQPVLQRSSQLHQPQWRRPPDREVIPLPNHSSIRVLVCMNYSNASQQPSHYPCHLANPPLIKIIVK